MTVEVKGFLKRFEGLKRIDNFPQKGVMYRSICWKPDIVLDGWLFMEGYNIFWTEPIKSPKEACGMKDCHYMVEKLPKFKL